jgi:hypothetical protein
MAVRNAVPSHLRRSPCRICGLPTPALSRGQILAHPVCPACRTELDRQFRVASLQRRRQEGR